MQRRDFLQKMALAAPALTLGGRLFAAPPGSPRFLLVFLRGGYDCANVVIPYSSSYYYESRPNIAVAKPTGPNATDGTAALDSDLALAPLHHTSSPALYASHQA